MEDWKKSEGTFNLACDPQRASGMIQNTCVKIEHVTKRFGEDIVLQEVNLSLKTGNVYGIVGNNGSGKTVLMKCICGFLPVTTGTIFVFGKKIGHDVDFPESLGVIIETPGFLTQYTAFEIRPFMSARISRFLNPVYCVRKPGVSIITPRLSGKSTSWPIFFPNTKIVPVVTGRNPQMHFIRTVFPEPLFPTIP